MPGNNAGHDRGPNWDRTSDPFGVNEVLSH